MADDIEGNAASGRTHAAAPKPRVLKEDRAKPRRKVETPTLTDDLTGTFLRVGNALYRTSDDKTPIARLQPDRLTTSNIDALPDIVRIAKANGWTSIRINGGDTFKKAAFLAAAAQGLTVDNYAPSKLLEAEAARLQARIVERDKRRETNQRTTRSPDQPENTMRRQTLSERFLSQTHEQNSGDPDLRRAQSLVAQAISIARAKHPDDPAKASKYVEARRMEVARRIARGDKLANIEVRIRQSHVVREITREQVLGREGRTR